MRYICEFDMVDVNAKHQYKKLPISSPTINMILGARCSFLSPRQKMCKQLSTTIVNPILIFFVSCLWKQYQTIVLVPFEDLEKLFCKIHQRVFAAKSGTTSDFNVVKKICFELVMLKLNTLT